MSVPANLHNFQAKSETAPGDGAAEAKREEGHEGAKASGAEGAADG